MGGGRSHDLSGSDTNDDALFLAGSRLQVSMLLNLSLVRFDPDLIQMWSRFDPDLIQIWSRFDLKVVLSRPSLIFASHFFPVVTCIPMYPPVSPFIPNLPYICILHFPCILLYPLLSPTSFKFASHIFPVSPRISLYPHISPYVPHIPMYPRLYPPVSLREELSMLWLLPGM